MADVTLRHTRDRRVHPWGIDLELPTHGRVISEAAERLRAALIEVAEAKQNLQELTRRYETWQRMTSHR